MASVSRNVSMRKRHDRLAKSFDLKMSLKGDNGHLLETVLGIGEIVADVYEVGGEVFSSIPVVGPMFQMVRAANSTKDRILAAKIKRFLEPFTEVRQEDRDKFRERLMQDEAETRRVGEALFLTVDRLTDLDKAKILGCLFVAFLNDQLTSTDLRRMAQAVDISFVDDLAKLVESEGEVDQPEELWLKFLVPAGLAELDAPKTIDDVGNIYYSITELGRKLCSACPNVQGSC
jgi:hypothetical protein